MKTQYTIGLSLVVGAIVGAAAVHGVHLATAAPKKTTRVYYIAETTVLDTEAYAKEYLPKAKAQIKKHGGKNLASGGSGTTGAQITTHDGDPPSRISIFVWDSWDAIKKWREDPEVIEHRKVAAKYAKLRSFSLEGNAP